MSLITPLAGAWTWDGSTTVLSDATGEVVAADQIKFSELGSTPFEIESIVDNVSVLLKNPHSYPIPSGSGAFKTDEWKKDAILGAVDVVLVETKEDITEPHAAPGTQRVTRKEYSSATVQPGKIYREDYQYVNPPSDPGWGALAGINESIV